MIWPNVMYKLQQATLLEVPSDLGILNFLSTKNLFWVMWWKDRSSKSPSLIPSQMWSAARRLTPCHTPSSYPPSALCVQGFGQNCVHIGDSPVLLTRRWQSVANAFKFWRRIPSKCIHDGNFASFGDGWLIWFCGERGHTIPSLWSSLTVSRWIRCDCGNTFPSRGHFGPPSLSRERILLLFRSHWRWRR